MAEHTIELTADNFEAQVLQSETPVAVDFWAPWCAPCRTLAPVIEELAEEYAGRATIGKLNIDDHAELAARYRVSVIPTVIFFRAGEEADRVGGLANRKQLSQKLMPLLPATAESPDPG